MAKSLHDRIDYARAGAATPAVWLARELEVSPNQLHAWRRQFEERPDSAFSGEGRRRQEETAVAELERKIGQQAMEVDFLKGCLRQIEELRKSQAEITPYNYIVVVFDEPAKKRFELNFVKAAMGAKNAYMTIYGVRVTDPKDYMARSKAFLSEHSGEIGKELEKAASPVKGSLPRREF